MKKWKVKISSLYPQNTKSISLLDDEVPKSKKTTAGKKKAAKAEDYQKLDQIEHALKRPDMYIGNATMIKTRMWVYDKGEGMNCREISYVPGLYKIFDEILVNAADNKQRDNEMSEIKVDIDPVEGSISVYNDGQGKI